MIRPIYYTPAATDPTKQSPTPETIGIAPHDDAGLGVLSWFHHNVHAYSMAHAIEHEGYSVGEPMDDVDCHAVAGIIERVAKRLGLAMSAEFVPFSASRHARPGKDGKLWRSLNWRIRITGRRGEAIETDYAQGEAYAPAYSQRFVIEADKRRAIAWQIEHGRAVTPSTTTEFGFYPTAKPIAPPSIGDVLQSLASDSGALDAGGFENWAADFGYDTDSRTAEATYRACLDTAMRLRSIIGQPALDELRLIASFN